MSEKAHQRIRKQVPNARIGLHCHMNRHVHTVIATGVAVMVALGVANVHGYRSALAAPAAQDVTFAQTPAVVASNGARLYASPGGEVHSNLTAGTVITAIGRSQDNLWISVQTFEKLSGWVHISEIVVYDMRHLPVTAEAADSTPVPSIEAQLMTEQPAAVTPLPSLALSPASPSAAIPLAPSQQTGQISLVAIVLVDGAGLYDRPDGTQMEQLTVGLVLAASGRSPGGEWLFVRTPLGSTGWVQIADVVLTNAEALPVMETPTGTSAPSTPETAEESTPSAQPTPTPPVTTGAPAVADSTTEPSTAPNATSDRIVATVAPIDSRLNIRSGPGTEYRILGQANPGETFDVNARNAPATWIQVKTPVGENGLAWVAADFVLLSHPLLSLTVYEGTSPAIPTAITAPGITGCTTDQIIKWESERGNWVCSDELTILQAEVAALQAEVATLRAMIIPQKGP